MTADAEPPNDLPANVPSEAIQTEEVPPDSWIPLTDEQLLEAEALRFAEIVDQSSKSLGVFLANLVIDCRPESAPWATVMDDWQNRDLVHPLIPAIESMAGNRKNYHGPRKFFFVLPRGHDKTGLIGRITSWALEFSKHQISAIACAADKDQAALLLNSIKSEGRLNPWLGDRLAQHNYHIRGKSGQLDIIASDAPSSSGLKADLIVCDEITWWRKRDLFDILFSGTEKRPEGVFIIITNAGMLGSWQHDLLLKAKADTEDWHVFEAPPNRTLASWMTQKAVAKLRNMLSRGIARRVLDNIWIDATETPLLTPDLIDPCCDSGFLWTEYHRHFGYKAELYIGIDVGRTHDLTVAWVLEVDSETELVVTRHIEVIENKPFAEQKAILKRLITRNVVKVNIDKGAVGYQLAEELEEEFPGKVEGVALSSGRQGQLAVLLKSYFQGEKIRIPKDPIISRDLQQVSEVETGPGGTPIIKTDRTAVGHADRFWALALALSGLPIELGPRYHRAPRGIKSRFAGAV